MTLHVNRGHGSVGLGLVDLAGAPMLGGPLRVRETRDHMAHGKPKREVVEQARLGGGLRLCS